MPVASRPTGMVGSTRCSVGRYRLRHGETCIVGFESVGIGGKTKQAGRGETACVSHGGGTATGTVACQLLKSSG